MWRRIGGSVLALSCVGAVALIDSGPTAHAARLPTLLAGGGSCWLDAIQLSGSHVTWTSVIAAPGGGVQISGSEITGGRIVAGNVKMSGSNITLS
jgi:hypothetical protein